MTEVSMVDIGSVKVVSLPNFDILNMSGVNAGLPEPEVGVNSISPEWQMNPSDDSSTNFMFAMRLAGANAQILTKFASCVQKKGDWNLKNYKTFLGGELPAGLVREEVDHELTLVNDTDALCAKTAGILDPSLQAFSRENEGALPTYGDILAIEIPAELKDRFPATWRMIVAVLGPDSGCRNKRPFVNAFRTDKPRNIIELGEGMYKYTDANENPTRPMFTKASKATLFALVFKLLMKAHHCGLSAVVMPQVGLSVFNHDAVVAQDMIALGVKAYNSLISCPSMTLYVSTVDNAEEVQRVTGALKQALSKWSAASTSEVVQEIMSFLPDLRKIPKPHVRPKSKDEPLPLNLDEPGAFQYDSPNADVLNSSDVSWEALSKFLLSKEFLHFETWQPTSWCNVL